MSPDELDQVKSLMALEILQVKNEFIEQQGKMMESLMDKWLEACRVPFDRLQQLWFAVLGSNGDGLAEKLKILTDRMADFFENRLRTCPALEQLERIKTSKKEATQQTWDGIDRRKKDFRYYFDKALTFVALIISFATLGVVLGWWGKG